MKLGFFEVLTLIFVALKLMDKIDWSWWLVLSPVLIGWGITLSILAVAGVIAACAAYLAGKV